MNPIAAAPSLPAEARSAKAGALAALSLAMLLPSLGISSANVALPTFAAAFGASFQAVQWIVLAYLLAITTLIVTAGRLGDVVGRRPLLLGGIALFALASLACGAAPTLALLLVARAAQGIGAAIMMALTLALVGETVPREKTGSAMGLLGTMSAIGTALGPSLGGLAIAALGWRAIFLLNVPLAVVALWLAQRCLPLIPAKAGIQRPRTGKNLMPASHEGVYARLRRAVGMSGDSTRFDHAGTLMLVLTLAAYALAMTLGRGGLSALTFALLAAAGLGVVVFLRIERRAAAPLIRLALFRDRALTASLLASLLVSTVIMVTFVVGPFYLARTLGLTPVQVGFVMSAGPVTVALTGIPAGRIVDRVGARRVTLIGLAVMALGCALLAAAPATLGVPGYVAPVTAIAAGYAVFQTANNTAVMADVPQDKRGVISGILNLSRNLGLITGASLMGAVFAAASGAADVTTAEPHAVAFGLRVTFAVAGAMILTALLVAGSTRRDAY